MEGVEMTTEAIAGSTQASGGGDAVPVTEPPVDGRKTKSFPGSGGGSYGSHRRLTKEDMELFSICKNFSVITSEF